MFCLFLNCLLSGGKNNQKFIWQLLRKLLNSKFFYDIKILTNMANE